MMDQLYAVSDEEICVGCKLPVGYQKQIKKSAIQQRQEIRDHWAEIESGVRLTPLPDLHLLKDMGRGTWSRGL
jgi:hypothetical protein